MAETWLLSDVPDSLFLCVVMLWLDVMLLVLCVSMVFAYKSRGI